MQKWVVLHDWTLRRILHTRLASAKSQIGLCIQACIETYNRIQIRERTHTHPHRPTHAICKCVNVSLWGSMFGKLAHLSACTPNASHVVSLFLLSLFILAYASTKTHAHMHTHAHRHTYRLKLHCCWKSTSAASCWSGLGVPHDRQLKKKLRLHKCTGTRTPTHTHRAATLLCWLCNSMTVLCLSAAIDSLLTRSWGNTWSACSLCCTKLVSHSSESV